MSQCPKCGKELKPGAKFCTGCGAKVEIAQASGNACPSCGRELKPGAKFCTGCGAKVEMKSAPANVCPSCGRELKPGAKFCTGCGAKVETAQAPAPANVCPSCGRELKPGAKFCTGCGAKIEAPAPAAAPAPAQAPQMTAVNGFITWSILPGEIAVRIDAADVAEYGSAVKGVVVPEGLKALIFNAGQFLCEVGGGRYCFSDGERIADPEKKTVGRKLLSAFVSVIPEGVRRFFQGDDVPMLSFVLVRAAAFPLLMELTDFPTATVSTNIGLNASCEIADNFEFYRNMLLDAKSVGFKALIDRIKPAATPHLTQLLAGVPAEEISNSPALGERALPLLQSAVSQIFPFLRITSIVQITANNADLEGLRKMNEELYVSEKELEQLRKRNDFANRLQEAQWEQELYELQTGNQRELTRAELDAQQEAAKEKIYEKMQLTEDERAKFDLMLAAEKMLREAKTQNDVEAAMQEYTKSGMLREQELDNLRRQIATEGKLKELQDGHQINMTSLLNQQALDQQKAEWEMAMSKRRTENDIAQQRMKDSYSNERRNADAQFEDSRRKAEIDLDRQEQQAQLDMLRQAQAIRQEREDAEHRRSMETVQEQHQFKLEEDKQKLDAGNEEKRIYAGMSFEQIMAANPNISEAAAQALAKKFEAEGAAAQAATATAQADKTAQMAMDQRDQMMAFMQQQMAMMKEMSMAGITAGAMHQQAMLNAKQDELDRTRADASANSDRFVDGMKTTINAVAGMPRQAAPTPAYGQPQAPVPQAPPAPAYGQPQAPVPQAPPAPAYGQPQAPAPAPQAPAPQAPAPKGPVPQAEAPAPAQKVCPACHTVADANDFCCPNCGQRF